MKRNIISVICFITVLLFTGSKLIAQEHHEESESHSDATEEHGEHHFHKHHFAVLNGATSNFNHHSTDYSVGLDYEYRFSQYMGVGIEGEFVAAESQEVLGGIPFFIHPFKGDKIIVEPMVMYTDAPHHESADAHAPVETEKEASFALRVGTGYDFHYKNFSFGPTVNFDIGKTKALVYELSLGVGF